MGHREVRKRSGTGTGTGRRTGTGLGLIAALLMVGCSSGPEPVPQPRDDGAARKAQLARILEVYKAFDFSACGDKTESCARTFSIRAGADIGPDGKNKVLNPRAAMPENPDATWLPEWARLPTGEAGAHYAYEALALAAVHRTYRAACEQAHAKYATGLTTKLETLDKEIAAKNREPNPYDRLGGLLALQPPKPDKSRLHEFAEGSDAVRFKWEAALFEAFEETKRTFVYTFDGYAPSDELLGVMHPRQPKEYEVEAYCLAAARGLIGNVPAMPDTSSWDTHVKAMVRRFVPEERGTAIDKRRAELADVTKAKFAKVKVPNPQLPPGVRELTLSKIASFERDGRRATLTTVLTREDRSGAKLVKVDESATATFEDWPSGVVPEIGDTVSFYGAETSVKELVLKSTPELEHKSRQYVLEGKHVTKIVLKSKTLVYFK